MTTTILNKYSSSSSVGVGKLSGDGNELLMGEDKTDSVIPFVVSDDSYYYSTEIVSETQISADQQQLLMNNLLPCSHAYSSIDQVPPSLSPVFLNSTLVMVTSVYIYTHI